MSWLHHDNSAKIFYLTGPSYRWMGLIENLPIGAAIRLWVPCRYLGHMRSIYWIQIAEMWIRPKGKCDPLFNMKYQSLDITPGGLNDNSWIKVPFSNFIIRFGDNAHMSKSKNNTQSNPVITRSNIVRNYINDCSDWGRISIRFWIQKKHPIPRPDGRAMGCLCEYLWENCPRYNGTALYCISNKPQKSNYDWGSNVNILSYSVRRSYQF